MRLVAEHDNRNVDRERMTTKSAKRGEGSRLPDVEEHDVRIDGRDERDPRRRLRQAAFEEGEPALMARRRVHLAPVRAKRLRESITPPEILIREQDARPASASPRSGDRKWVQCGSVPSARYTAIAHRSLSREPRLTRGRAQ